MKEFFLLTYFDSNHQQHYTVYESKLDAISKFYDYRSHYPFVFLYEIDQDILEYLLLEKNHFFRTVDLTDCNELELSDVGEDDGLSFKS